MLKWFKKRKWTLPVGICDNNPDKYGSTVETVPILSFASALAQCKDLYIVITSTKYADSIQAQILQEISPEKVLNIAPFFLPHPNIERGRLALQEKMKSYTDFVRGKNKEVVPLLTPSDMPEDAKGTVAQLLEYQTAYKNNENISVPVDDYFIRPDHNYFYDCDLRKDFNTVPLVDFLNQANYLNVHRFSNTENKQRLMYEVVEKTVDLPQATENVAQFHSHLKKQEIPFLYVQLPNKLSAHNTALPKGCIDHPNKDASDFLQYLNQKEVPNFDYRREMIEENINSLDCFLNSDHHWKPSLAFRATKSIFQELNTGLGFDFDLTKFDFNQYEIEHYPSICLGTYGGITGLLYSGLDDFELILPKYETNYTWSCKEKGFEKKGTAKEALILPVHLNWSYFNHIPYAAYSLMSFGHTKIENHLAEKPRKIFVLNDSFCYPIAHFMAPHCSELHFMDIRGYLSKKDVLQTIEQLQPDLVLMCHWPYALLNQEGTTDINPFTH